VTLHMHDIVLSYVTRSYYQLCTTLSYPRTRLTFVVIVSYKL